MARGKHLFPFRTEKLSPSAPMVLGPQGPGRVGRRRFVFLQAPREAAPLNGAQRTDRRAEAGRATRASSPRSAGRTGLLSTARRRPPLWAGRCPRAAVSPGGRDSSGVLGFSATPAVSPAAAR